MIRKLLLGISLSLAFLLTSCEDKVAEEKLVVDNFGITLVDKIELKIVGVGHVVQSE